MTRLGQLLRITQFRQRIKLVVVDEIHLLYTTGIPLHGLGAFRPCYGRLGEIKALIGLHIPWLLLSATVPFHMLAEIKQRLLSRGNYLTLEVTSNRPNTLYAKHRVSNGIMDFRNYHCFVKEPFSLDEQPSILIFLESTTGVVQLAQTLDGLLPPQFRWTGLILHYHGNMSAEYLEQTHKAFTSGTCKTLVTTSAESTVCN